jgi:starch synthase (maltosyl-transferring)
MAALGLTTESFSVTDLIDGKSYQWGRETYIRLDPTRLSGKVIHIAKVKL